MGEKKSENHPFVDAMLKHMAVDRKPPVRVFQSVDGERLFDKGRQAVARKLDAQMHPESHPLPDEEEEAE